MLKMSGKINLRKHQFLKHLRVLFLNLEALQLARMEVQLYYYLKMRLREMFL